VSLMAIHHVRRMRGGAQSHLMRCSDGRYYVVKFQNNPQHLRVLTNEMLATRLAEAAGLPVPATEVIEVSDSLIDQTPELQLQLAHGAMRCASGLQFGSRYVVDPLDGQVLDYMPVEMLGKVRNLRAFVGALVIDKWTCNTDGRQVAFWRYAREHKYTAAFIDQGYCFNAGDWTFPDYPLRGVYPRNEVYASVTGWDSFQPWLGRMETMPEHRIWEIAETIPTSWYFNDTSAFRTLISTLLVRRVRVRDLIQDFRNSERRPFPQWIGA
jgi:hypothetical protein